MKALLIKDTVSGYGWISIGLHWATAIVIIYMLYLGSSISSFEGADRLLAVKQHTSIAVTSYVLLLARIAWRYVHGHPGPTKEQRGWAFTLGKWTHYSMLVALAVMLITGPLMQFSYGNNIEVFDWFTIASPIEASSAIGRALHSLHSNAALVIFIGLLLHIGGVYKHTAFNQDGTLAKIIIAGRQSGDQGDQLVSAEEKGES